ncbi:MAG: sulfite exporter TauE/SafE family protein [Candidatus Zapsychrus exili]|nr:sulfite exporter TauE/SafE family protein [Candidatus Zapsychrus exili]
MSQELIVLLITAASIGFFHTLFGPDHYVPFIVMSKAKKWSYWKTFGITFLCGLGHVGSSIVLGIIGVLFGVALQRLEFFESVRGGWAAWALIAFGLVYTIYGIKQAIKNKPHTHLHFHQDGEPHEHQHTHNGGHVHVHEANEKFNYVPWALFVVFVLGPCEPLIPILMYPALKSSFSAMILVAGVFSLATISTMLGMVLLCSFGISFLPIKRIEKYSHALAGLSILACGCAIQFLGL